MRGEFNADILTRFSEQIYVIFYDTICDKIYDARLLSSALSNILKM